MTDQAREEKAAVLCEWANDEKAKAQHFYDGTWFDYDDRRRTVPPPVFDGDIWRIKPQPQQEPVACCCGEPLTLGVVHRKEKPCFYWRDTAPPSGVREGSIPVDAIMKVLGDLMEHYVSNGANSVSMPDECVEVAAWLQGIPTTRAAEQVDAEGQVKVESATEDAPQPRHPAPSAPQSEQTHVAVAESHCVWMQDSDGPWNTSCGHVFEFIDGGPHENGATWCQYCGGKLLPQYHDAEQESVERNAALLRAATGKESE